MGSQCYCATSSCFTDGVNDERALEYLSLRKKCIFRHRVHPGFCVLDDADSDHCGETSLPVVEAETQTNCHFEANILHCTFPLDSVHHPYSYALLEFLDYSVVWPCRSITLLYNLHLLLHN